MTIEIKSISKRFQQTTALNDISFNVEKGELFGLIGPDGAGKTSLFKILATLSEPNEGEAYIEGLNVVKDFKALRNIIGYMPGKFSLYQDLSVEENLTFFASIFNADIVKNMEVIHEIYTQIEPFRNRKAGKLSGGMKQKLALCCALIHRPKILLLDEPTTGVDTVSRKEFWLMLKGLKKHGITILVSTPYMDEASLCDRIALIQEGQILSINTPERIIENYPDPLFAVRGTSMYQLQKILQKNDDVKSCFSFGEFHHVSFKNKQMEIPSFIQVLEAQYGISVEIKPVKPTIEDCFIQLMK